MTDAIDYAWDALHKSVWRGLKDVGRIMMNPKKNAPIVRQEEEERQQIAADESAQQAQAQAAQAAEQQQQDAFKDWKAMPENDPKWNEFQQWQAQQQQGQEQLPDLFSETVQGGNGA